MAGQCQWAALPVFTYWQATFRQPPGPPPARGRPAGAAGPGRARTLRLGSTVTEPYSVAVRHRADSSGPPGGELQVIGGQLVTVAG